MTDLLKHLPEWVKNIGDLMAVSTTLTVLVGFLSSVVTILAGIATLIWTVLRIQDLLENRRNKRGE